MSSLVFSLVKQSIWLLYSLILMHYSGWLNVMHQHWECPNIEILNLDAITVGQDENISLYSSSFNSFNRNEYLALYYKKNFLGLFGIQNPSFHGTAPTTSSMTFLSDGWLLIASCITIHAIRIFSFGFFVYSAIGSVIIKKLEWMEECRISHRYLRPFLQFITRNCTVPLFLHLLFLSLYLLQISCQVFCWEGSTLLEFILKNSLFGMFVLVLLEILIISLLRRVLRGSPEKPDEQ
ncbi:hypothetical protein C9374_000302 [Naegleria lovaniensis]|uniref:Transmembrane protein n=1 Tax=Naegleria lovaniensis TaxID=51637 RepID=A0AA88GYS9_NAELO|nr:uncharacterized protein C9374_000302 [Naegleria lovaniensis]KAG2388863.1 hypothetical protein C9374_000302 [Naegleria lovaniensis]